MARYYRVASEFWPDTRNLDPPQRLIALYLLTCPHRNLEGLYYLPADYIKADTGIPFKAVNAALNVLADRGFIAYDRDAEVVFVRNALRYQAPATEKQIAGAIAALDAVPRTTLWNEFVIACESHCQPLAKAIANRNGKRS